MLISSRLWIARLIAKVIPETRCFGLKACLLRWSGAAVGQNVRINSSVIVTGTGELEIGDDVWIGAGSFIMSTGEAKISIGSQCDIGPQVMMITGTHEICRSGGHIAGAGKALSVNIGSGSWLGARSLILPGVRLKNRTVVAAGSVVTRSNQNENELLAGNPAVAKKMYCDRDC